MSFLTGNIDNLFPFFTTNNSSSLNKILNSGKLKILSDLDLYFTFTQSHLGFSGFDFGSKYLESLSNCVGSIQDTTSRYCRIFDAKRVSK